MERGIYDEVEFYSKPTKKKKLTPEEIRAIQFGKYHKDRETVFQYLRVLQNCLIRDGKKLRAIHWVEKILDVFFSKFKSKQLMYYNLYLVF